MRLLTASLSRSPVHAVCHQILTCSPGTSDASTATAAPESTSTHLGVHACLKALAQNIQATFAARDAINVLLCMQFEVLAWILVCTVLSDGFGKWLVANCTTPIERLFPKDGEVGALAQQAVKYLGCGRLLTRLCAPSWLTPAKLYFLGRALVFNRFSSSDSHQAPAALSLFFGGPAGRVDGLTPELLFRSVDTQSPTRDGFNVEFLQLLLVLGQSGKSVSELRSTPFDASRRVEGLISSYENACARKSYAEQGAAPLKRRKVVRLSDVDGSGAASVTQRQESELVVPATAAVRPGGQHGAFHDQHDVPEAPGVALAKPVVASVKNPSASAAPPGADDASSDDGSRSTGSQNDHGKDAVVSYVFARRCWLT
jgi:hypothetical protein